MEINATFSSRQTVVYENFFLLYVGRTIGTIDDDDGVLILDEFILCFAEIMEISEEIL